MGNNNAYEYKEHSLVLAPADTAWKYLSEPLHWKHWNKHVEEIEKSSDKQYVVRFHTPKNATYTLQILDKNRDSLSFECKMQSTELNRYIKWKIKPRMALCSLFVEEKTQGNHFLDNAKYAFDVEAYDEAAEASYDSLRLMLNAIAHHPK